MEQSRLIPFNDMKHHPTSEKLVEMLMRKSQNTNPGFFRVMVAYYFSVVASMMHCKIRSHENKEAVPVNTYAVALGTSGSGKGLTMNLMEKGVLGEFFSVFREDTLPILAERCLATIATQRASRNATDPDQEYEALSREYKQIGPYIPIFDSGTAAAVKQARQLLLLQGAGSLNLLIDEVGSNLLGNIEVLTTYLEMYDMGEAKQKLLKSTNDNRRTEELKGATPANVLLLGTPSKLLDGDKIENEFMSAIDTGYGRRSLFAYVPEHVRQQGMTPEQIYRMQNDTSTDQFIEQLSRRLGNLANMINMNKVLVMDKDVALSIIEYRLLCNDRADKFPVHMEIHKAEMAHRYWKCLKLAGAYAFIDDSPDIKMDHWYNAIKLVEESGEHFHRMLNRERPYVKLAKYIAAINKRVTQAELVEDLPFYKGSAAQKADMMTLAVSYGYKNNIIIKKAFEDGIEFLHGESLDETDINKLVVAYSQDISHGYVGEYAPFDKLHTLTQMNGYEFTTHHFLHGHRIEEEAIAGFNMIVLDVDGTCPIPVAQQLLQDYKYLMYTTKSHTETEHRYRIIMPISHVLKMDGDEFKEFMRNVFEWLPFDVDTATGQRARKWAACNGQYHYNDGKLLDILPFIPKTSKNEERKKLLQTQQEMDNLERWVINNTGDGNRNNQLLRYAMILVDAGKQLEEINARVNALNDKMADKLSELEIAKTIMVTVQRKLLNQA